MNEVSEFGVRGSDRDGWGTKHANVSEPREQPKQMARTLPVVSGTLVPLDFRRAWLNGAVIFLTKLSVREIRGF